jgi:hypothetical protein
MNSREWSVLEGTRCKRADQLDLRVREQQPNQFLARIPCGAGDDGTQPLI